MTTRDHAPLGAPCWVDLWTSDIPGSRAFYGELFGWESGDPDPQFGGYFIFTRQDVDIAGCMGDMGEGMTANDTWKIYLATDDIAKTTASAEAAGAEIIGPAMPVADLGIQSVLVDPTGAHLGAWQAGTFPGFTVLDEHGSPSWFELHTDRFAEALDFYGTVFHWKTTTVGTPTSSVTQLCRIPAVRSPWPDHGCQCLPARGNPSLLGPLLGDR